MSGRNRSRSLTSLRDDAPMMGPGDLLALYDAQLRTEAETAAALRVERIGPLHLATFAGGRGHITYRDLDRADAAQIATWVAEAVEYYRADPQVVAVEWKTRAHDRSPGLHEALTAAGFVPEEPESIMLGEATGLTNAPPVPAVTIRRVSQESDIRAMAEMQDEGFGSTTSAVMVPEIVDRIAGGDPVQFWVAEASGEIVSAGRLQPVEGSDFAGIWGGATRPSWRRRGIYRALTAARAHAAIDLGKTLIHSDSTPASRPVLERSGLTCVSSTTPYRLQRCRQRHPETTRNDS